MRAGARRAQDEAVCRAEVVRVTNPSGVIPDQLTWYDVLDILPTAEVYEVHRAFAAKASVLRPELIAGAPSAVVAAVGRAGAAIEAARQCLSDPAARQQYDVDIGVQQPGGGLDRPTDIPSEQGPAPLSSLRGAADWDTVVDVLGGLADLLAPHPARPRRVMVPEVRGLFITSCGRYLARRGLRLEVVRLTADPMPVEGLVVDQRPLPGGKAARSAALTAYVWHPRRRR
jgi:hypothetical protein